MVWRCPPPIKGGGEKVEAIIGMRAAGAVNIVGRRRSIDSIGPGANRLILIASGLLSAREWRARPAGAFPERRGRGQSEPDRMNKAALIQLIVSALSAELDGYARSARSAQAEATDEQSKAENKYDTRGLEASYLARGQSRQAMETVQAMQQYLALVAPALERHAAIEVGAVVEVEHLGEQALYFLGPCAGGTEVVMDGRAVTVITPQSPLGQQLMGAKAGAQVILPGGRKKDVWKVRAVE